MTSVLSELGERAELETAPHDALSSRNIEQFSLHVSHITLSNCFLDSAVFQTSSGVQKQEPNAAGAVTSLSSRQQSLWGGQNQIPGQARERMLQEDDGDYEYYYYYYDAAPVSMYGMYGFYGVTAPSSVDCDVLIIKFTLYNYGARDLTHVSTIRFIIDKTKEAIDLTYLEAVPTGSTSNYETTVTELDGSAVTHVTVTAEVNFQAGNLSPRAAREAGGVLASYLGIIPSDLDAADKGEDWWLSPPAPDTGVASVGVDILVSGYTTKELEDENEMAAFQTTLQSSFQSAILACTDDSSAAAGATIQLVGITDADSDLLAVRVYVRFAEGKSSAHEFEEKLERQDPSLASQWGPLAGRIKISTTVPATAATFTDVKGNKFTIRDSEGTDRRHLLQNGGPDAPRGAEANHLSRNLADVGLGRNTLEPRSLECRPEWNGEGDSSDVLFSVVSNSEPSEEDIFGFVEDLVRDLGISSEPEVSILSLGLTTEVLASFLNDPNGAAALAAALRGRDGVEVHSDIGSSGVASSGAVGTDGSSWYGFYGSSSSFYGFYGSSSESSQFTSAHGSYAGSSALFGSSGAMGSGGYYIGSSHVPGSVIGPRYSSSGAIPGGVVGPRGSSSAVPPGAITSSSGLFFPGGSSSAGLGGGSDSAGAQVPGGSSSGPAIGSSGGYELVSSGAVIASDGTIIRSDGTIIRSDGTIIGSGSTIIGSDGTIIKSDGTIIQSDGTIIGSSDGGFYGYKTPSRPSSPNTDSSSAAAKPPGPSPGPKPKPPGPKPKPPSPPSTPAPETTPVYFTTILSDYNMEDLETEEDMAQFRSDYVAAVDSAIKLLGITSNPAVTIEDVLPASVAVPTVVTFVDDPSGAQLFMEVLASNPSLAFPAFSGLGTITIVDVSTEPTEMDGRVRQKDPITNPNNTVVDHGDQTCPISRAGESCCSPATLDAQNLCCWKGVDECGICAGNSDTCATTATVRVLVTRPGMTADVNSPEFADMEEDFKAGIANLFSAFNIQADNIIVDTSSVTAQQTSGGLEFDIPFRINPDVENNVAAPTLTKARAILVAAAEQKTEADGMTIIGVLNVARAGVCGNGHCEIGEFFHHVSHTPATACAADCPDYKSCPAVGGKVCGGAGQCATDAGLCVCSKGWDGPACTKCAPGYKKVNGKCTSKDSTTTPVEGAGAGDRGTASSSSSSNARDIILGVVFGIVALVLIGLLCYYLFVIRKRNEASKEEGLAFSSQQQVPASNEEPDIPTRQLTENTV